MKNLTIFRSKGAVAGLAFALAATVTSRAAIIHVPADYPTIQAAVDAAVSGDEIQIAAGVYVEQVVIADKTLTLSGAPGAVLRAGPGMGQTLTAFGSITIPLLGIAKSQVVVSGLSFEGERLDTLSNSGPIRGILMVSSSGTVEDCHFTGFRAATLGAAGGADGLHVVNPVSLSTGVVNVQVLRNTFADNITSIRLVGDAPGLQQPSFDPTLLRTRFSVKENVILGNGPSTTAAQYGIWINTGAGGQVQRNIITDHGYVGTSLPQNQITPYGIGILAIDALDFGVAPLAALQPVRYEGNVFLDNQVHMAMARGDGSMIVNNAFEGTAPGYRPGGLYLSGEGPKVVANRFDNMDTGIVLFGLDPDLGTYLGIASNAKLEANKFCGVTDPIVSEPLVTGTKAHGNKLDACH